MNNYVIDPLGDLYKCWNEIGRKEKAVGNVVEGPLYNNVMVEYLNYEAITDKNVWSVRYCQHVWEDVLI